MFTLFATYLFFINITSLLGINIALKMEHRVLKVLAKIILVE